MKHRQEGSVMTEQRVEFRVSPDRYRHWKLSTDGPVATLAMDVDEQGGLVPGYELKLNSYDLGVDIELYDAVQRLRFEHPEVRAVVITSGKPKIFCAGANIRMLAASPHGWKVNFCKFTNETRNGIEDATAHSGQTYLAAVNGTASGGGYELALACEHIMLVDDRSSAVSLPELPLLGVLPGTGGVTRELDDLILDLRTNEAELGTWVFRTEGDPARVLAYDELVLSSKDDWFAGEVLHYLKRTLRRLDVTSRSLIAAIEPGSCFAGSVLELALAADRSFQLAGVFEDKDPDADPATVTVGEMNLGPRTMSDRRTQ